MSQIVVDAEIEKQIGATTVQVVNSKGTVIGVVTPIKFPHSPFSREEVEAARKQCRETGGKSLTEILAALQDRP